MLTAQRI